MNKEIFYKNDLYTLEWKYTELEFIELLDTFSALNNLITPFINNVTNSIYDSIKKNNTIKVTDFDLPNIADELERSLSHNQLYKSYKNHTEQSLSRFTFNKFLQRIFEQDGDNNESHTIQRYFHSWLEKKLAQNITQDSRFNSFEVLRSLMNKTQMLHVFYNHVILNIPKYWVKSKKTKWVEVTVSSEKLLESMRVYSKEYFENYIDSLQIQPKENLWSYTQEVTLNSDYIMLNHEFSFISSVLIKKDVSLWIEFWDNLKLPIIQDSVFHSLSDFRPHQYLELVNELVNKKKSFKSKLKVLLFILAKNFFDASLRLTERLSIYESPERKNERNKQFFHKGVKQQKEWNKEKKQYYDKIIKLLKKQLSNSEIEDWIFSYKPRTTNRQFKPNKIYNSEIKLLTKTYRKNSGLLKPDFRSFNLQKFNFYIEITQKKEDNELASSLLEAITNYISSDKFFWDKSYSEPYFSAFKGLGFILSKQDNPIQKGEELINNFKTIHQGWNPSKIDTTPLIKESFVCCGVALLIENDEAFKDKSQKEQFFKRLLNHILKQDRYSQFDNSEYYQMPLHLLFLVASKVFLDVKEYCEQQLIDYYDNLYSLLLILSSSEKSICDSSKMLINERLNREYLFLRKKLNNSNQADKVQELEKMLNVLNLGTKS
ncbi:hypothetical protein [Salibacter halophilus]|uniref:Uncharacterized protein n=1 Tax=Salibacter halophilus TaxID=1803916 RepID=A0A6N6M824_9FLAO|nr:hypothetical protein [Salibacter halophilus]KAB1064073.1 hypothetical protein F3059_08550 [Salibacter halophilus]